jgi:hypothetical protein
MVKLAKEVGDVRGYEFGRARPTTQENEMSKRNKSRGTHVKGENREKQTVGKADVGKVPAEVVQNAAADTSKAPPARTTQHAGKIKLMRGDVQYKGNRAAWYARLKDYDGKPLQDFLEAAAKNPPALTRNQTPEPPMGWFSFFKREGVASVV